MSENHAEQKQETIKEGDVFYTSWGYDQTNYDYIVVEKISPTGKTAICKLAKIKTVNDDDNDMPQHNGQIPTSIGYGLPFRMKIVSHSWGSGQRLRGSYPFCSNQADNPERSMRLDGFRKVEPNKVYWETHPMYGH